MTMSEAQSLVIIVMAAILLSSILGGIGGAVIVSISARRSIEVRPVVDGVLDIPVQLHSDPVALRVRATVAEIEPIVIQVATAPLPNVQDMAARILSRFPDAGPTDIAEIAGCAKSTAHAIIADYKNGFGAALQTVDQG
jgi:hypothetical protein